jgi:hypothetical protein
MAVLRLGDIADALKRIYPPEEYGESILTTTGGGLTAKLTAGGVYMYPSPVTEGMLTTAFGVIKTSYAVPPGYMIITSPIAPVVITDLTDTAICGDDEPVADGLPLKGGWGAKDDDDDFHRWR